VHPQLAALLVLGDGLDHRPEDVRVDLGPVEAADVQQVGPGDLAELRHVVAAGEQTAVDVGEVFAAQRGILAAARSSRLVFMARNSVLMTSCVLDESLALICRDGFGEFSALADEDVGVLGEEAEDQPRHEVFMSWRRSPCPIRGCPSAVRRTGDSGGWSPGCRRRFR
jgi:hypothetical protein